MERGQGAGADGPLEIPTNRRIGRLSQGQQQRLSIIRALAHEPDLLVLDEPVASLDPLGRRDFLRELVEQVLDRGTTVVFSTHILSDLERVAFNIAFLSRGKIALEAPQDQLADEVRLLAGDEAVLRHTVQSTRAQVLSRRASGAIHHWIVRFPEGTIPESGRGLRCEALGLEDLFVELAQ